VAYKIKATQTLEPRIQLSLDSTYVFPSDGYLQIVVNSGASYFTAVFENSDATNSFQEAIPGNPDYYTIHAVFVKKGMMVGGFGGSTDKASVYFRPLSYL
jgi:hypothetical protein